MTDELDEDQPTPVDGSAPVSETPDGVAAPAPKSAEYEALMERFTRATADYQNSLKRVERAMRERSDYAIEQFARELLPVADNLQRALQAASEHQTVEKIIEGIELVQKQLHDVFARHGITQMPVKTGEAFDPERHEAISIAPSHEHEPNRVVHEAQRGYQIRERLLRPAHVVVSGPKPDATPTEGPEELPG